MATSQNGFRANDRSLIATSTVAGARFPVRKGDVSVVLMHVAQRFHNEVEPLNPKECYGYAERKIRGSSTTLSNHASGTAIDLNSSDHWLGETGTFSKKERKAIAKILAECDGVIRWGGNYHGRKDEMHFEINKGTAAVAALAKKITKTGGATVPAKKETDMERIHSGSHSKHQTIPAGKTVRIRTNANGDYTMGATKKGQCLVTGYTLGVTGLLAHEKINLRRVVVDYNAKKKRSTIRSRGVFHELHGTGNGTYVRKDGAFVDGKCGYGPHGDEKPRLHMEIENPTKHPITITYAAHDTIGN
jgi:hypothetical protein